MHHQGKGGDSPYPLRSKASLSTVGSRGRRAGAGQSDSIPSHRPGRQSSHGSVEAIYLFPTPVGKESRSKPFFFEGKKS